MSSGSSWSGWRLGNARSFSNIPLVIPTAAGLQVVQGPYALVRDGSVHRAS